jgi:hypothetical protein
MPWLILFFLGSLVPTVVEAFDPRATATAEAHTCLRCHGDQPAVEPKTGRRAPLLPEQFSMQWSMFEFSSNDRPPFTEIPKPYQTLRGTTHYDWTKKSMTEIYYDKCIDIFPNGRDFPCQFTSVDEKTYLIRFSGPGASNPASCCLWEETGFWAPRPDVIRNMAFDKSQSIGGQKANWWILDIPMPGPFGFGFFKKSANPAAFWFPVISGWVQQNFSDFSEGAPGAKAFVIPVVCQAETLTACTIK